MAPVVGVVEGLLLGLLWKISRVNTVMISSFSHTYLNKVRESFVSLHRESGGSRFSGNIC